MRKKLLKLVGTMSVFALALSAGVATASVNHGNVEPLAVYANEAVSAVDFALDESKWADKTGLAFGSTYASTTARAYNVQTVSVGGNSKIEAVYDSNYAGEGWSYTKLMFKVNGYNASAAWDPAQGTASGSFFAFIFGNGIGEHGKLYECVDGVVTQVASIPSMNGNDYWYTHNQKTTITVETTDTATGVDVKLTFTGSDCRHEGAAPTGTTYTLTYSSTNKNLWGAGSIVLGDRGYGEYSETQNTKLNLLVTDVASDYVAGQEPATPDNPDTPEVTGGNYSSDASKWETVTGVAFDDTKKDMYLTSQDSLVGTKQIGGNSTINIKSTGNCAHQWSYNWIMFKNSGAAPNMWQGNHVDKASSGTGNWLALVYGGSTDSYIAECVDGVITKTKTYWSGNDTWYPDASTMDISIQTTDTEEGVNVKLTLKATGYTSNTGNTLTYEYNSTNKAIWGAQRVAIGTDLGAAVSADTMIRYDVEIDDVASDKTAVVDNGVDFALDASKWATNAASLEIGESYATTKVRPYDVGTVAIGGNSKIEAVYDSNFAGSGWSYTKIMFKVNGYNVDEAWNPSKGFTSSGNWLAFVFGNGHAYNGKLYECKEGVVSEVASVSMSGYDYWYIHNQKNTINIETTDTETGVDVKLSFVATDCRHEGNTPTLATYSITYSSTSKALWGEGSVVMGDVGHGTISATTTTKLNLRVKEADSEYTQDMYTAGVVSEKIAALATEVTDNTYADVKVAYNAAKAAYDGLTDEAKALVSAENVTKLNDLGAAIVAYEAAKGVENVKAGIAALPTEITRDSYEEAKTAINNVNTMYNALSEEQKAEISADEKTALDSAVAMLASFETALAAADEAIKTFDKLPTEAVAYRDTYQEAKAAVIAAETAYAALSDEAKALIDTETYGKIAEAKEFIAAYEESVYEPVTDASNLAQSKQNWTSNGSVNATNVTYGVNGLTIGNSGAATAMLLKKNIVKDSKIELTFDANAAKVTSWGQNLIVFKNVSGGVPDAAAVLNATSHGGIAAAPAGTWMGLMFGNSVGLVFYTCVDGELTTVNLSDVPSTDYNSAITQLTNITIQTKDTATGVEIIITYEAEGLSIVTGEVYTYTTTIENTAFHGDYAFSVGAYYGCVASNEGESITVRSLKVTNEGGNALVNRVIDDGMANHATSIDYWKLVNGEAAVTFSQNGIELWDTKTPTFVLNRKIEDQQTVYFEIDGGLAYGNGYGNMYFVFKHDSPTSVFNGGVAPAAVGNYIALMIGGDGFYIIECVDGQVGTTNAEWVKLADPGSQSGETGNNLDVWAWYSQYTKVAITTKDVEDGVECTIELYGGNSGGKIVRTYFSENTKLWGDSYVGLEFFNYADSSSGGWVTVTSVKVEDVAKAAVADVNVSEINGNLSTWANTAVTAANVAELTANYESAMAIYESLNYTQLKTFDMLSLQAFKAKLDAFPANEEAANAVETLISAIPAEITEANYEAAKTAIEAAEAAYSALNGEAKALVENYAALTAARAALDANAPKPDTPDNSGSNDMESGDENSSNVSNDDKSSEESSSCFSSIMGSAGIIGLTTLASAAFVALRKKED